MIIESEHDSLNYLVFVKHLPSYNPFFGLPIPLNVEFGGRERKSSIIVRLIGPRPLGSGRDAQQPQNRTTLTIAITSVAVDYNFKVDNTDGLICFINQ